MGIEGHTFFQNIYFWTYFDDQISSNTSDISKTVWISCKVYRCVNIPKCLKISQNVCRYLFAYCLNIQATSDSTHAAPLEIPVCFSKQDSDSHRHPGKSHGPHGPSPVAMSGRPGWLQCCLQRRSEIGVRLIGSANIASQWLHFWCSVSCRQLQPWRRTSSCTGTDDSAARAASPATVTVNWPRCCPWVSIIDNFKLARPQAMILPQNVPFWVRSP